MLKGDDTPMNKPILKDQCPTCQRLAVIRGVYADDSVEADRMIADLHTRIADLGAENAQLRELLSVALDKLHAAHVREGRYRDRLTTSRPRCGNGWRRDRQSGSLCRRPMRGPMTHQPSPARRPSRATATRSALKSWMVRLRFELDRVRIERGDVWGTMTVRTTLSGARTYNGVLSTGSINLSSVDTRHKRARQYADLARAPQIDFLRLIESFAYRVHDAVRIGEPAVDLRDVPPAGPVDTLDLHGIQILDKHPIIPFGNGGCGKSLLALWLGGELVRRGLTVLYADWELSAEDHRDRLARLFGPDMPSMLYARCTRPLTAEADRLRRLVRQHGADYLICDSVAFACDGRPEDAEVALRYFQCLRQIGVGSMNIAHTNKSEESDKQPFGSSSSGTTARVARST